jgi:hypothetical protein
VFNFPFLSLLLFFELHSLYVGPNAVLSTQNFSNMDIFEKALKLVVVGDARVGKVRSYRLDRTRMTEPKFCFAVKLGILPIR